jgi:hypothetical protein
VALAARLGFHRTGRLERSGFEPSSKSESWGPQDPHVSLVAAYPAVTTMLSM